MPTKNKKFLLKKLGNRESLTLSRAEVYRIVENERKVIDPQIQQVLLTEIVQRKDKLTELYDFNYVAIYNLLTEGELTQQLLSYLLVILFGEHEDEQICR